jgi:hypothetical protein
MVSRIGWHASAVLATARRVLRIEDGRAPFMVSFPRSGSHFLQVCLEKYLDGHSPITGYGYLAGQSLFIHRVHAGGFRTTHDLGLGEFRANVIYLYRNPLDTLYSFLRYEGIAATAGNVAAQAELWVRHTRKWMFEETASRRKVILCYEKLMADFPSEFSKLTGFLSLASDQERMARAAAASTKNEIHRLVGAKDPKAIADDSGYHAGRAPFLEAHKETILSRIPQRLRSVLERDAAETGKGALARP